MGTVWREQPSGKVMWVGVQGARVMRVGVQELEGVPQPPLAGRVGWAREWSSQRPNILKRVAGCL